MTTVTAGAQSRSSVYPGVEYVEASWTRQGCATWEAGLNIGANARARHPGSAPFEARFAATPSSGLFTLEILPGAHFLELFDSREHLIADPVHPDDFARLYAAHGPVALDVLEQTVDRTYTGGSGSPTLRSVLDAVTAALATP